jgi:hypothetical protein
MAWASPCFVCHEPFYTFGNLVTWPFSIEEPCCIFSIGFETLQKIHWGALGLCILALTIGMHLLWDFNRSNSGQTSFGD